MAHRTQPGGGLANEAALEDNNGKAKGGEFLALDMGQAPQGDQYMQMQMMEGGSDTYMQQRSTAIESIESTISELGQIFGQLAHMVAEQRDTVQRIDSDVYDVADNVSGAQRELLKYYASVSSNRWLMLKIFGVSGCKEGATPCADSFPSQVLIVFFLLFILVSCECVCLCRRGPPSEPLPCRVYPRVFARHAMPSNDHVRLLAPATLRRTVRPPFSFHGLVATAARLESRLNGCAAIQYLSSAIRMTVKFLQMRLPLC